MKTYGEVDVYVHAFLTSALFEDEWSASRPGRFTPGTHLIGAWVGPRTSLDAVVYREILHWRKSHPVRPVRGYNDRAVQAVVTISGD
jgi:hypothetical protein